MRINLKKRLPLLYEFYLLLKNANHVRKRKKNFYKLSIKELQQYDSQMYEMRMGKKINWSMLNTYTEKMQWAKIYDNDPKKVTCADKYAVREWVSQRIGDEYLVPLIGVWNHYSEIDFEEFPEKFVIKTNHGSGDACIVKQKSKLKTSERLRVRRIITTSLKTDYSVHYCEMHYGKIPPKIIAEEFIESGASDLQDYKFLCFDGIPYFCWVDIGRYTDHKRNVYDMEWNLQNWNQRNYGNYHKTLEKPKNFNLMIEIVKKLASGFSHVRVDLYNVHGRIYFGEMTFTNGSGFEKMEPEKTDEMLGNLWHLDISSKLR